jgi:hypothetical protein
MSATAVGCRVTGGHGGDDVARSLGEGPKGGRTNRLWLTRLLIWRSTMPNSAEDPAPTTGKRSQPPRRREDGWVIDKRDW